MRKGPLGLIGCLLGICSLLPCFPASYKRDIVGWSNNSPQHRLRTSTFPLSVFQQIIVCIHRAQLRLVKNIATDISNVIANALLGIIVGSVFYDMPENAGSLRQRALLIFFALMINAFVPGVEVVTMWAQRPIVEKQFRYAFYHPFTERLASVICDLPTKVVICFAIHLPIYFMANLRRSASAFFVYWLFMFVNLVTMSMFFRMIGAISRTHMQTTTPVSVAVLLFIIYTGFIVPPTYMKPWLGWVWRINPLGYTYGGLLINEVWTMVLTYLDRYSMSLANIEERCVTVRSPVPKTR